MILLYTYSDASSAACLPRKARYTTHYYRDTATIPPDAANILVADEPHGKKEKRKSEKSENYVTLSFRRRPHINKRLRPASRSVGPGAEQPKPRSTSPITNINSSESRRNLPRRQSRPRDSLTSIEWRPTHHCLAYQRSLRPLSIRLFRPQSGSLNRTAKVWRRLARAGADPSTSLGKYMASGRPGSS